MPAKNAGARSLDGISDTAVKAKTGKTWAEWFSILDKAKASTWPHKQIALWLSESQGVPNWWCQMVTVEYERARGLREKHQKAGGFAASASKTIGASLPRLYAAFSDAASRKKWLPGEKFTVRTATENKSMRITWSDGTSSLSVHFYAKGPEKSQITLEHEKLASRKDVDHYKAYWGERLDKLKSILEKK
jgi:hypothetical protein